MSRPFCLSLGDRCLLRISVSNRHAPNPGTDRESRARSTRVRSLPGSGIPGLGHSRVRVTPGLGHSRVRVFPGSVVPGTGNPGLSYSRSCDRSSQL